MNESGLQLYKDIVDGLADLHEGVHRVWVMERGYPDTDDNKEINELLKILTPQQKQILAKMMEDSRSGGIHDTLVYLNDRMAIDGLRFTQDGVEVAHQPFDTELHYDWTCRRMGDDWPDEE